MNGKQVKLLRGQVRLVIKELLPEVLKEQLFINVQKSATSRLDSIETMVKESLKRMDDRQKDVSDYIVRQVTEANALPNPLANPSLPTAPTEGTPSETL